MADQLSDDYLDYADRMLGLVIDHPAIFSAFEMDFAMATADRFAKFGTRTILSEKQMQVIARIEEKAEKEGLT